MVKRNLTIDYEFVCYTEDPTGIDPNITVKPLPDIDIKGWWFKILFFNPEHELQGNILFLDLDVVVFKNIDNLFTYKPGRFCIIRDFNRHHLKAYQGMNSSIFRITTGSSIGLYKNFIKNTQTVTRRYRGDQEYIYSQLKSGFEFWPDEWIQSYKWEMRGRENIIREGTKRKLKKGSPTILPDTRVAVFHGEPNPHECEDPWVIEHWQ